MTGTSTINGAWYLKSLWGAITTDWYSIPLFAVPLPLLIWSFNKWISYNQSNADRNTRIQDALDRKMYKEVIVPLHNALSANLAETVAARFTEIPEGMSLQDFLQQYEEDKIELLKQTDYTSLEEVIKFQDAMENVIREKKNKFILKSCSRQNKRLMFAVTILSLMQILDSVLTLIFQDTIYFSVGLWAWLGLLAILLGLIAKYGINENTIDNLDHV